MRTRLFGSLVLSVALASCGREPVVTTNADTPENPGITNPVVGDPGVTPQPPSRDTAHSRYSQYSGFGARRRLVVRDAATWDSVWTRFVGSVRPVPATPAVDFTTQMVLVATMGTKNSGGYSISIDAVNQNEQGTIAVVRETSPGTRCAVTGALTSPAVAVFVPLNPGPVSFREKAEIRSC
jgi:hypothetical protein